MRYFILGLFLSAFIPFQFVSAQVKVQGYVVEVTSGTPIENAVIFVNDEHNISKDPSLRDTTDINGFYEISVDTGRYHFGVYAPYQFEDEDYLLVYQPGIFSISESSLSFFKEYGFKVSYGLSKTYFETLHIYNNDRESLYTKKNILRRQLGDILYLTKPRVNTNSSPSYTNKPIIYIEKKTW